MRFSLLILAILALPLFQPLYLSGHNAVLPVEYAMMHLRQEHVVAWNEQGVMLFSEDGTQHDTTIQYVDYLNLWNGSLTHNHPSGYAAPSYQDYVFAWYWQLKEMRVVANGQLRILRRVGAFWNVIPAGVWQKTLNAFQSASCRLMCAADLTWQHFQQAGHYEYIEVN